MKNGIVLMILSGLSFLIVNVLVKIMATDNSIALEYGFQKFSPVQLVFFRSLVSFSVCVWVIKKRKLPFWGNNKKWLLIRGAAGVFALTIFFFTLAELPIAVASIVQYLSPIFTVLLAVFFLKENVKLIQWLFIGLAFSGVLILGLRNGSTDVNFSSFWIVMGIFSALGSSIAYFAIVKLKDSDKPIHVVLYFPMLALPITGIWASFNFVIPNGIEWIIMILIGVFTQIAQVLMTRAFHTEQATVLVPFQYLGAIYAFLLGLLVFDERLSPLVYTSLALIFVGVISNAIVKSFLKAKA